MFDHRGEGGEQLGLASADKMGPVVLLEVRVRKDSEKELHVCVQRLETALCNTVAHCRKDRCPELGDIRRDCSIHSVHEGDGGRDQTLPIILRRECREHEWPVHSENGTDEPLNLHTGVHENQKSSKRLSGTGREKLFGRRGPAAVPVGERISFVKLPQPA